MSVNWPGSQDSRAVWPPANNLATPGYTALWPLSSWATVEPGTSGITHTETPTGIEWSIPAGAITGYDDAPGSSDLPWRATGLLSDLIPAMRGKWWSNALIETLLMRHGAVPAGCYASLALHTALPPANDGGDGGGYQAVTMQHAAGAFGGGLRVYRQGNWVSGIPTLSAANVYGLKHIKSKERYWGSGLVDGRANGLLPVGADGNPSRSGLFVDLSAIVSWAEDADIYVTLETGRVEATVDPAVMGMAPQVFAYAPAIAQEGS